jgi:ABC-2 type transport system permease protein
MADKVSVRHDLEHTALTPPSATSGLLEAFRRRYLLRLMVRREIQARYARSLFGLAWSYINPTVRFFTFYFVFGILLARGNIQNFAIHLFAGMVLVHYFTETVNSGTKSLLANKGVVQKMAMPRELFPFASMLVSLYHTIPQMIILTIACLWTRTWDPDLVGMGAALLGFTIVLLFSTSLGLMFSVFNVLLRDFGRIVQTFINMLPFTVPMMYPYSLIDERFGGGLGHTIYMLSPVTEAVLLMQRGFWYTTTDDTTYAESFPPDLWSRGFIMLAVGLVLLAVAQWVFTRLESKVPEMMT